MVFLNDLHQTEVLITAEYPCAMSGGYNFGSDSRLALKAGLTSLRIKDVVSPVFPINENSVCGQLIIDQTSLKVSFV